MNAPLRNALQFRRLLQQQYLDQTCAVCLEHLPEDPGALCPRCGSDERLSWAGFDNLRVHGLELYREQQQLMNQHVRQGLRDVGMTYGGPAVDPDEEELEEADFAR